MVLWWIANAVGFAVVIPVVLVLAARVLRTASEAQRYADEILEHGVLLAGNLDPVPGLATTQELIGQAADHAGGYVAALKRLV